MAKVHEMYFHLQVRMRLLYERKSVTSGAGFRSSVSTVLAASDIRFPLPYIVIYSG